VPSPAAAHGSSGNTPKPVARTTAASAPKGTASATFIYGQLSASLSGQRLCLTVPVTVSNSGSGSIYDVQIHLNFANSTVFSGKTALAVAPHASSSITFTLCASGYTGPSGVCNGIYLLSGGEFWGDPDPALAGMAGTPSRTISYCIPR
jgi:hypothetical protein